MPLFEKKQDLSRAEVREALRKASYQIPGGGGIISKEDRVKLEKEVLPRSKFGDRIDQRDYDKGIRDLEKAKYAAKTSKEKIEIDRQIRVLKSLRDK